VQEKQRQHETGVSRTLTRRPDLRVVPCECRLFRAFLTTPGRRPPRVTTQAFDFLATDRVGVNTRRAIPKSALEAYLGVGAIAEGFVVGMAAAAEVAALDARHDAPRPGGDLKVASYAERPVGLGV